MSDDDDKIVQEAVAILIAALPSRPDTSDLLRAAGERAIVLADMLKQVAA